MNAKALLLRVGLDLGTGGALGPIYPDGTFEYVPIPETVPSNCPFTYATLPGRHVSALAEMLPARLAKLHPHIDPDFKNYTYGDALPRKRRQLLRLNPGDLLVFYAGLAPEPPVDRRRLFAVGYFRVRHVHHLRAADIGQAKLVRHFGETAHILRRKRDEELALVEGEPAECVSFERALPLGDECDRLFPDLVSFGYQGSLLRAVGHWIDTAESMKALEAWLRSGPVSLVTPGTRLLAIESSLRPEGEGHLTAEAGNIREGDWIIAFPGRGELNVQAFGRVNRIAGHEQASTSRGFLSLYWCFADRGPAPAEKADLENICKTGNVTGIRNLVSWFVARYRIGYHLKS